VKRYESFAKLLVKRAQPISTSSSGMLYSPLQSRGKAAKGSLEIEPIDIDHSCQGDARSCSVRQAHLLNPLQDNRGLGVPNLNDDNIMVFRQSKKDATDGEQNPRQYEDRIIDVFEASKQQCNRVMILSLHDFEQLVEIWPQACSCNVTSTPGPFNDGMEIDFKKVLLMDVTACLDISTHFWTNKAHAA
jgi:hypothetical protein